MANTVREFRIAGPEKRRATVEANAAAYNAENEITKEESNELIEELASTTILYESFGLFIHSLNSALAEAVGISFDGNPVRTHVAIRGLHEDLIVAAHALRDELIEKLAQYGDQITEKGNTLRKQVLQDDADSDDEVPF